MGWWCRRLIASYRKWIHARTRSMLHLDPLDPYKPPSCSGNKQKNYNNNNNNIGRFPGGGLGNQNPARTITHSPPGVKETLNYMLGKNNKNILFIKPVYRSHGKPL